MRLDKPGEWTEEELERFNQKFNKWHAEHSISIPAKESCPFDVGITVWNDFEQEGRYRMAMGAINATGSWSEQVIAYLNQQEARQLSDLLLATKGQRQTGHSVVIPANKFCYFDVGFTVWDDFEDDGRFRVAVRHIDVTGLRPEYVPKEVCAYLTPEEGRRLSDLLPAAPLA